MKRRYIGPVDEIITHEKYEEYKQLKKRIYEEEMEDDEIRPLLEEIIEVSKNKLLQQTDEYEKPYYENIIKCPVHPAICAREIKIEFYKLRVKYLKGEIAGSYLYGTWVPKYMKY